MLHLKDIRDLNSILSNSDEESRAQGSSNFSKTAQHINAELGPEIRAYHALGRVPFLIICLSV